MRGSWLQREPYNVYDFKFNPARLKGGQCGGNVATRGPACILTVQPWAEGSGAPWQLSRGCKGYRVQGCIVQGTHCPKCSQYALKHICILYMYIRYVCICICIKQFNAKEMGGGAVENN